jgi:drug/metabolite transporter (DMT)-like permease
MLDALTITLMLLAAVLHATWHSLVKSGDNGLTILTGMCLVSAVVAALFLPFVALPPAPVWPVLMGSVLLHSGYRLSLAQAYAHGDLSQAYPLARGLVPLFATALAFVSMGQLPTAGQLVGIGIVSVGLIGLAGDTIRGGIRGRLLLAAAGAGLTVAGYSVVDAYGARLSGDWASYTAWLIVLDSGSFFLLCWAIQGRGIWSQLDRQRWRTLISGVLGLGSFAVFLWALSHSPVGAVSALRETSVLFATMIGILVHGEKRSLLRIASATAIVIGIGTIAVSAAT